MPKPIQSIERASAILRLLSGRTRRLSLTELAGQLGLPKGTVYGILRTLVAWDGLDHPVHPNLPESAYLKAQLLQLS